MNYSREIRNCTAVFSRIFSIFFNLCVYFLQAEKEAAALEEILGDPETIAQLDWLWSNKISANVNNTRSTVVEISQQVDKGCVKEELKPIERYVQLGHPAYGVGT